MPKTSFFKVLSRISPEERDSLLRLKELLKVTRKP